MQLHFILYALVAALMILVILSFVCFVLALRWKKRNKRTTSSWERSVSIEHLRFVPRNLEEQRIRTSTPISPPIYANQFVYDFYSGQNHGGSAIPAARNPPEIILNPVELHESNRTSYAFKTFTRQAVDPKIVYWETCI